MVVQPKTRRMIRAGHGEKGRGSGGAGGGGWCVGEVGEGLGAGGRSRCEDSLVSGEGDALSVTCLNALRRTPLHRSDSIESCERRRG